MIGSASVAVQQQEAIELIKEPAAKRLEKAMMKPVNRGTGCGELKMAE
jgi:hypothetical protein